MDEIDFKQIRFSVLGIFIVIFGLIIWYLNTDYYTKKVYLDFKKLKFKATVFSKKDEHPIRSNKIYLNGGPELIIHRELFDKLKKGDSVIKQYNSDSIYFYTSLGTIIDDYNKFKREKYLESLKD